jgi:hypothetical protein
VLNKFGVVAAFFNTCITFGDLSKFYLLPAAIFFLECSVLRAVADARSPNFAINYYSSPGGSFPPLSKPLAM